MRWLTAVGLGTAWSMLRKHSELSAGERARAELARALDQGAGVDEFTSAVDRATARALALGVRKYVCDRGFRQVVFASCHDDVRDWLRPDWVLDAGSGQVVLVEDWPEPPAPVVVWRGGTPSQGGAPADVVGLDALVQRQRKALMPAVTAARAGSGEGGGCGEGKQEQSLSLLLGKSPLLPLRIDIERADKTVYDALFADHHYKRESLHPSSRVYVATLPDLHGVPVGLIALLHFHGMLSYPSCCSPPLSPSFPHIHSFTPPHKPLFSFAL